MERTAVATPVREIEHVVIVDDDGDVRSSMDSLFRSIGLKTMLFASAHELIEAALPSGPCCLVVDVLLPKLSGLELPERLAERGIRIPFVFITGFGDVPMTVRAMKAGAVDVLTKPVREQELLDAVAGGLEQHRRQLGEADELAALHAAYASLTVREREVMALVVAGLMNKQIAGRLDLSEVTVKLHRATMLKKMGTRTVADLVRMSEALARAAAADHTKV